MFNVHCYLDGKRTGGFLYQHIPRVGDTMRFDGDRYGKVTEVIWCMDEPTADGQRVNLRVESIAAQRRLSDLHTMQYSRITPPTPNGQPEQGGLKKRG